MQSKTLEKFLKSMQNSATPIVKQMEDALFEAASMVEDEAYYTVPVQTGDLRDSIKVDMRDLSATITADEPYADKVHARDPFIYDAYDNVEDDVLTSIEDEFFNAVASATKDAADG